MADITSQAVERDKNFYMIVGQVVPNDVTDKRIIDALRHVQRESFVQQEYQSVAYVDEDLPLGHDSSGAPRYIMEPNLLAQMLKHSALTGKEKVLEIGCGSGYTTALLAHLAHYVYAVEMDEILAGHASNNLQKQGITNVHVSIAPLEEGQSKDAPYDLIFVNGALAEFPKHWLEQLKDGGRAVFVQRKDHHRLGKLMVAEKINGVMAPWAEQDAFTEYLPGLAYRPDFQF